MPQISKHTRFPFAQHGAQSPTSEGILRSPPPVTSDTARAALLLQRTRTRASSVQRPINGVASGKRMEGPQAHAVQSAANRRAPLSQVVTRASMMAVTQHGFLYREDNETGYTSQEEVNKHVVNKCSSRREQSEKIERAI